MGVAAFARSAPLMVVGPFAGIVADRVPRERILAFAQGSGLATALLLAVLFRERRRRVLDARRARSRVLMRRAAWGDPQTLVPRARRLFGASTPLQRLRTRGIRIQRVCAGRLRGEWLLADRSDLGVLLYLHGDG